MRHKVYARVEGGTEAMYRALSLLRRKSFDVVELAFESGGDKQVSHMTMTLDCHDDQSPFTPKVLIEKVIGFSHVSCQEVRK